MKFKLDKEYMKRIFYVALGFVVIYIIYLVLPNISTTWKALDGSVGKILHIFEPFFVGVVIAFLLDPVVKWFEAHVAKILNKNKKIERISKSKRLHRIKERLNRHDTVEEAKDNTEVIRFISLLFTFLLLIGVLIAFSFAVYTMITGSIKEFDISNFLTDITVYVNSYQGEIIKLQDQLTNLGISTKNLTIIQDYVGVITGYIETSITGLVTNVTQFGQSLFNFVIGLIFAINFIMQREFFERIRENVLRLLFLNKKRRNLIKEIGSEISELLHSFITGMVVDLTLLGFVTSVALLIVGFDYAILVGFFAGYTNIIPYLGSFIGIIPAIIIALATGGWQQAVFIAAYILVVQFVYIMGVTPRIQGNRVGLHPAFALLSMMVFGNFLGIVGVILAIPLGGIVQIFVMRIVKHRQKTEEIELLKAKEKV